MSQISQSKSQKESPQDLYNKSRPAMTRIAAVYEEYEKALRQANALDFDDLLLESVRLLYHDQTRATPGTAASSYIMIDEYQDTNRSQYELMRLLSQHHDNVCVVGDEDQSIYSWRGADIRNILDFEKDFPRAKTIRLEQNYRSTKNILEAASVGDREQPRAQRQVALDRSRRRRHAHHLPRARRRKRSALHRRHHREDSAPVSGPARGGSLPNELAVAPDRRSAAALQPQVQRRGRLQLLPARRSERTSSRT
jgi:ATP-dependent exoDNAse (exonuclease V) beta subunit